MYRIFWIYTFLFAPIALFAQEKDIPTDQDNPNEEQTTSAETESEVSPFIDSGGPANNDEIGTSLTEESPAKTATNPKSDPCSEKQCDFGKTCVVKNGKPECQCAAGTIPDPSGAPRCVWEDSVLRNQVKKTSYREQPDDNRQWPRNELEQAELALGGPLREEYEFYNSHESQHDSFASYLHLRFKDQRKDGQILLGIGVVGVIGAGVLGFVGGYKGNKTLIVTGVILELSSICLLIPGIVRSVRGRIGMQKLKPLLD